MIMESFMFWGLVREACLNLSSLHVRGSKCNISQTLSENPSSISSTGSLMMLVLRTKLDDFL